MPGLFNSFNLDTQKTTDSSIDLILLDTTCDHRIVDEAVDIDLSTLLSGTTIIPASGAFFNTKYPYVNDGSFSVYQYIETTKSNPMIDDIKILDTTTINNFSFPPKINSTIAKEIVLNSNNETTFLPFTNYKLYQLDGKIQFTNQYDVLPTPKTIRFKYLSDQKIITEKDINNNLNYKLNGLTQDGKASFTIFGRALYDYRVKLFIRYKTLQSYCTKCNGIGVLNDINFNNNGRLQLVYDYTKMVHDFFKRLYTEKGSNPLNPLDGTNLLGVYELGKNNKYLVDTLIKSEIVQLLNSIREKQSTQTSIQGISDEEQILSLKNIDVSVVNNTDLFVNITVVARNGKSTQISTLVRS
jgi:hypothetical protein